MSYLTWPLRLITFLLWYIAQVVTSNLRVTADIVTPDDRTSPLVIRFVTNCRSELEIAVLTVLISLTPGTLVLAVDRENDSAKKRKSKPRSSQHKATVVYVHAMYDDRKGAYRSLQTLHDRMLHALRREEAGP